MKLTKTWLSYIIWGLFSIIFFADIGIAAIEIYQKGDMQDFLIPVVSMYVYAFLGILIIYILFKLYEKFLLKKLKTDGETVVLQGPLEYFILAMVLFIATSVRVIAIISASDGLEGTGVYFEYATSVIQTYSLDTYSNGAYIFGNVLTFILSFLGHMERAAMGVQAGIQVITLIALYFMVKKALGRLPAWIGLLLMAFLPGSFLGVRSVTPDALFTLFFVLFMLGLVYLCDANVEQKIKLNGHGIFFVLLGLAAAFLAYYDIAGILSVVIGVVALLQFRNEDAWLKIQKTWMQILIFILFFVLGLVMLLWFMPLNGLETGPASLIGYFTGCIEDFGLNIMILSPHKGQWDSLALFIMAGLWFVGFLRDKKDKAFPYVFIVVVLTLFSFFSVGGFEYASLVSYAWIMLATVGITSIGAFRRTERDIAVAEKAKSDSEARKAEKERKRLAASGEKSIRLDDVNRKAAIKEPVFDKSQTMNRTGRPDYNSDRIMPDSGDGTRKGYGIGRKVTDEPVVEVKKPAEVVKQTAVATAVTATTATVAATTEAPAPITEVVKPEVRTVVRTVDKPPVPEAPTPVPVESKPAYSRGSRSRRQPSKSTFTPEQLENIKNYTSMNVISNQAVDVPVVVTEPEKEVAVEGYMDLTEITANTIPSEPVQDVSVVEEPISSSAEGENDAIAHVIIKKADPVISSNPALSYGSPSRRHFRHPSKSTFTPEELEKISQYTGVQYRTLSTDATQIKEKTDETVASVRVAPVIGTISSESATSVTESVKTSADTDKTIGGSRVIGSKPVSESIDDIKMQSERKPKMIRNPLPGPKPHVAKELNYDYIPKESEMKFDIEDMKGRDYFDF